MKRMDFRKFPALRDRIIAAMLAQGIEARRVERCLQKWENGAEPEACRYGTRDMLLGRKVTIGEAAALCKCEGCIEVSAFYFFDQIQLLFRRNRARE